MRRESTVNAFWRWGYFAPIYKNIYFEKGENKMKKLFSILLCTAMVFSLAACGSANSSNTPAASTAPAASAANPASGADTQAETTAWAPTKDVEIVTHSGVGSGGDVIGRAIIESCKGIVDANMFMQNKKGSAGSAVWAYVQKGKNDGHTLIVITPTNFLWYYNANNGMNPSTDLVPLVRFQLDPQVLCVHKDSPYQDIESFKQAYKEGKVTIAGEASGGPAWMGATIMADTLDCAVSFVPFSDGGEALTGVLGGNVDAVLGQFGECYDQIIAGEIVPIAFAESERIEGFEDVPTLIESGIDFAFPQWRGLAVPKDTPLEAIAYWEGVFSQSSQTEYFQKYLKDGSTLDGWMDIKEFTALCGEQDRVVREIIEKYGSGE
ncbi:tripartite tricarboxylate transporter substrate binding protein [Anaerotruncus colihominis]|uniref:Tripartite tricarboxylate transporter substrate binding protein n=2 Tax=Anaerotruncus colihominis TaxID=169435 RepID=A0A845RFR0_9FIRM|nr:tripartite tricarboxylate transporter substrate binding protein [Anaerotruncus colihominis]